MKAAKFVPCPRRIDDLLDQTQSGMLRPYRVIKTVELGAVDYENFITNMLAERQFLEPAAWLCGAGETMWCIKVKRKGRADGVLVVPYNKCSVGWAAYLPQE